MKLHKYQRAGLYRISNLENGKFYIGSSVNLYKRQRSHKSALNRNSHRNQHLQHAWNKYGSESFAFEIIAFCTKDRTLALEEILLQMHVGTELCYNISPHASAPFMGCRHTEETMAYLKSRKGQLHHLYGRNITDEHKARISAAMMGESNHFFGKTHTDESKHKMSEAHMGRKASDEDRLNMSKAQKLLWSEGKRVMSDDHKATLSSMAKQRNSNTIICPHCSKSGNAPNMKRWHFDNCKYR
jgi:group I intron endonuclease